MNTDLQKKKMKTKEEAKKGLLNYIDAIFGVLHFLVIIFPLILIQSNFVLSIIGIVCACLLLVLGALTFRSGELSYTNYGTALMVANWLFLIPLVIVIHFTGFFLVLEIPYLIIIAVKKHRRSAPSSSFYLRTKRQGKFMGHIGTVPQSTLMKTPDKLREEMQTEQVERQSNINKHLYISILLAIILLVVFLMWYDPYLELDITIPWQSF